MRVGQGDASPLVFVQQARPGDAEDTAAAVEALFVQLPAAKRLGPQTRVLVKPNLLAAHAPEKAVTTHPHVLAGVLAALNRRGVGRITVADCPGGPNSPKSMKQVYAATGVAAVCKAYGVESYTGCEGAEAQGPGELVKAFTFMRPVLEADFIINLPKLKTHVLTGMSGAVKNLFGCVPGLQKAEFHMRFPEKPLFARMLVDLCETVAADIHLVDGVVAMEGDGPGSGNPRQAGLLVAGENPYQVDLALCRYMGMDPMGTPVLAEAQGRGLCGRQLDETLLVGEAAAKRPLDAFVPPRSYTGRLDFSSHAPAFLRPLVGLVARHTVPKPRVRKRACIGCGRCAEICPQQVVTLRGGKAKIDYDSCIHCFCCHEICPVRAIDIKRSRLFGL